MRTPLILTILSRQAQDHQEKFGMNTTYFRAIYKAGGNLLCIGRPTDTNLRRMLTLADGVLIIGGTDVNPRVYKEKNHFARHIDRERDRIEILLAQHAIQHHVPILGVCRGMQVMNISQGGSLYQDVKKELLGAIKHDFHKDEKGHFRPRHLTAHHVDIISGTKLAGIIGKNRYSVNSLHHQGVKKIGRGFLPSATSPDGLVEGIEQRNHPFAIGVEWHPEELHDKASKKLFSAFLAATKACMS